MIGLSLRHPPEPQQEHSRSWTLTAIYMRSEGLLQWQYSSSIGISFFQQQLRRFGRSVGRARYSIRQFIWGLAGWCRFSSCCRDTFGWPGSRRSSQRGFSQAFLAEAISSHLSSGVGRANHFARAGNGHYGPYLGPGYGHAPASVFALDQFASVHGATY